MRIVMEYMPRGSVYNLLGDKSFSLDWKLRISMVGLGTFQLTRDWQTLCDPVHTVRTGVYVCACVYVFVF